MKYIVDASVALKWVPAEADSPIANKLRDEFNRQIHELLAPDTLPVEIAHALTRAERKGLIPKGPPLFFLPTSLRPLPISALTSTFWRERLTFHPTRGSAFTTANKSRSRNGSSARS